MLVGIISILQYAKVHLLLSCNYVPCLLLMQLFPNRTRTHVITHTNCICTYSGTPLLWTPWEPGEVSCIYSGILYCEHLGDLVKYPGTPLLWTHEDLVKCHVQRGVLISGVNIH